MNMPHRLAAASVLALAASAAVGAEIGSRTITNANHYGRRENVNNTVSIVTPASSGTVRWIQVSGTLTSTNSLTWARSLRVQPVGSTQLASGPGSPAGQGYFQFSPEYNFTGTIPVSITVAVPGGITANAGLKFEAYSVDSESASNGVPGLDGTSTLTYRFLDAIPNGGVDFGGSLDPRFSPRYNRAANFNADPDGPLVLGISGTATNVFYDVRPFHVATTGQYAVAIAGGFDTYLGLYSGSFDPADAVANLVNANDSGRNTLRRAGLAALDVDNNTNGISRLDVTLTAGVQYYAVTSTFANDQLGSFFGQIGGAGAVTLGIVPEPTALVTFGLLALSRRRR